jgi:hypothetical protein
MSESNKFEMSSKFSSSLPVNNVMVRNESKLSRVKIGKGWMPHFCIRSEVKLERAALGNPGEDPEVCCM